MQTVHVSSKYQIEHSFGLMWNDPDTNERVYLTTDTQFCPINAINAYFKEADHIFHDCETSPFASGVHAHYNNLKTLAPEVKSKMWLYHYHDNVVAKLDEMNEQAINDGFRGFLATHTLMDRSYTEPSIASVGKKSTIVK